MPRQQDGVKAAALPEASMSPRTIYLSRLIGLVIFVAAVSMLVGKRQAMATIYLAAHGFLVRAAGHPA
jgi:hypothetical protein